MTEHGGAVMNETVLLVSMGLLWVVVLFNLLLTLALVRRTSTQPRSQQKEWFKAGEKAPDFTAETLDGKPVTLASYAGRPAAFLFMSPSCDPCREHLPGYDALGKIARRAGTQLVYVSTSGLDETRIHVEEFGITLPVIVAPQEDNSFARDYKITGTPQYCLLDAHGNVHSCGLPMPDKGAWKVVTDAWRAVAASKKNMELQEVNDGVG